MSTFFPPLTHPLPSVPAHLSFQGLVTFLCSRWLESQGGGWVIYRLRNIPDKWTVLPKSVSCRSYPRWFVVVVGVGQHSILFPTPHPCLHPMHCLMRCPASPSPQAMEPRPRPGSCPRRRPAEAAEAEGAEWWRRRCGSAAACLRQTGHLPPRCEEFYRRHCAGRMDRATLYDILTLQQQRVLPPSSLGQPGWTP